MSISRRTVLGALAGLATLMVLLPLKGWAAKPLRIGVIGAGWLGGTVGRIWVRAGYEVMFSARDLDKVRADVAGLGANATVGTPQQAAAFGSVLLFAVPYDALPDLGRELAASLRGKVVLDACNPAPGSNTALSRNAEDVGVGLMSARLLPGARVVRAFSAVDATAIEASANRSGDKLGVPLAGDDRDAMQVAAQLVSNAGCEPVIVGNLNAARSFQRGGSGFRANTTAPALRRRMELSDRN